MHALLDGALPPEAARAAERHIAECAACRDARDAAADLRDAATGVLAQSAVQPRRMPTFAALQVRAATASAAPRLPEPIHAVAAPQLPPQWPHRRLAVQAASVAAAACLGWFAYARGLAPSPERQIPVVSLAAEAQMTAPRTSARAAAIPVLRVAAAASRVADDRAASRGTGLLLPAPTFARADTAVQTPVEPAPMAAAAPAHADVPHAPTARIMALEPGSTAGTMRIDTEFRLTETSDEADIIDNLEFPVLREPVRAPAPSALLRVRAASHAIDTLAGRSLLRRP